MWGDSGDTAPLPCRSVMGFPCTLVGNLLGSPATCGGEKNCREGAPRGMDRVLRSGHSSLLLLRWIWCCDSRVIPSGGSLSRILVRSLPTFTASSSEAQVDILFRLKYLQATQLDGQPN